jgi:hypothetical protein
VALKTQLRAGFPWNVLGSDYSGKDENKHPVDQVTVLRAGFPWHKGSGSYAGKEEGGLVHYRLVGFRRNTGRMVGR